MTAEPEATHMGESESARSGRTADDVDVYLYMYDLTGQRAKYLAPLLGVQCEAIWHTAIVVYDLEIMYGGDVLAFAPGESPFGAAMRIEFLGCSTVERADLLAYVSDELSPRFRVDNYDVFTNNCNHFTSALCEFLLGKPLDVSILQQPEQLMNAPVAQALRPFINHWLGNQGPGDQEERAAAESLAHARRRRLVRQLCRLVAAELPSDREVLWHTFLKGDEGLEGKLDKRGLHICFFEKGSSLSEEAEEGFVERVLGGHEAVSFLEILQCWEDVAASKDEEQILVAAAVRGLIAKRTLYKYTADKVTTRHLKYEWQWKQATMEQLRNAVHSYEATYFHVRQWQWMRIVDELEGNTLGNPGARVQAIVGMIRTWLSDQESVLLSAFLEHDTSSKAELSSPDVENLVVEILGDNQPGLAKLRGGAREGLLSLPSLLTWWHSQASSTPLGFSVIARWGTRNLFWKSAFDARLEQATKEELESAASAYCSAATKVYEWKGVLKWQESMVAFQEEPSEA